MGEGAGGSQTIRFQSPYEIATLIRTAILGRCPVEAVYEGRQRLLCPHMLGGNKAGQLRLLGYQYGGESGSGLQRKDGRGDWRCFSVEKLSRLQLLSAPWRTADTQSRCPTCMDRIELQVEDQPEGKPQQGQ